MPGLLRSRRLSWTSARGLQLQKPKTILVQVPASRHLTLSVSQMVSSIISSRPLVGAATIMVTVTENLHHRTTAALAEVAVANFATIPPRPHWENRPQAHLDGTQTGVASIETETGSHLIAESTVILKEVSKKNDRQSPPPPPNRHQHHQYQYKRLVPMYLRPLLLCHPVAHLTQPFPQHPAHPNAIRLGLQELYPSRFHISHQPPMHSAPSRVLSEALDLVALAPFLLCFLIIWVEEALLELARRWQPAVHHEPCSCRHLHTRLEFHPL